jgi:hypothetical protein
MKVFGAALIVSGGYLLGRIPGYQNKKRYMTLKEIINVFQSYKHDLAEYRLSIDESFSKSGGIAMELLKGCEIRGLHSEDRNLIDESILRLKNGSYRESTECVSLLLDKLVQTVDKLKENESTTGKALPLVTSVIGLLIAVLLF